MRVVRFIVLLLLVAAGFLVYTRVERTPPVIATRTIPTYAGAIYEHEFVLSNVERRTRG